MDDNKSNTPTFKAQVPINSSSDVLKGHYSNVIKVSVTDSEVILDFAFIYALDDKDKKGEHQARIIVGQEFAQKIASSITDILSTHKEKQEKKVK